MNNDVLIENKLKQTLSECESHQKRIQYALKKIQHFMPLDTEQYKTLDDEAVEALDQFLFRFSKLQDAIGQRLFAEVLLLEQESIKSLSFLDRLNRLEQLGVIIDKTQWLMIRDVRNRISHEYEDNPLGMCDALNHIYATYPQLSAIFSHIKNYLSKKAITK